MADDVSFAAAAAGGPSDIPRPPGGIYWDGADHDPRKPPRAATPNRHYPGDYVGLPTLTYAPHPGDLADPGEVVWAYVPYEEDHTLGKDRPVLVIGRDGDWLLGLPLSSVHHDLDARQEAEEHRFWVEIGTGAWDDQGRTSFVRVDRIVRLDPDRVRRIGGTVPLVTYARVADGLRRHWAD